MNSLMKNAEKKPDVSNEILAKWQRIVNLMARIVGVPAGLIMKIDPPQIEVLLANDAEGNPYEKGERADLNTGLYCETVINQCNPLLVPDALKDPEWDHNPDIELGMTFYFGLPLQWPDNEVFGTICVLDRKNNPDAIKFRELISEFQQVIETDLHLIAETANRKKVEAQLREKETLLRQMGDNLPKGAVYRLVHDADGHRYFAYVSSGFKRMFGLKPEELMKDASPLYELTYQDDFDRMTEIEAKAAETLKPFDYEGRAVFPNGAVRWYKWHSRPTRFDDGTVCWDGVCLDITDRKEAEEDAEVANFALRRERDLAQRYLHLVEVIIVTLDSDGTITMINRKGCELLGYKEEELLGKNWFHTCLSQPEGRETVYPVFKDIMNGDISTAEYFENEILAKDGQRRLIAWHNNYFRDEDGHIEGTISAGEDITERKRADDLLKDREQLYRSLFEDNYSVMLLIDPDTSAIFDANPSACAYYGYSKEALNKMKITEINMLSQTEVFQEMERAKSENRNYFNFRHRLSNGTIRDVEVFSGPITVRGKSLLCSIIHDISKRKRAEEDRERLINELQAALDNIKTLKGLLPICAECKKIRDDKGYWNQIEGYIQDHSDALFSHSICPECMDKLYGNEDWYKKEDIDK